MSATRAPLLHTAKRSLMALRRKLYGLRAHIPGLRDHHRFEAMVGPLGCWHELQRYQFRLLKDNGLLPHHRLLDIGCGPLQGGIAFIKYLGHAAYVGIDIDPARIAAANTQISRHRLEKKSPRVFVSTTFGRDELGDDSFDFVWASQIIYYFDDATMTELLTTVKKHLRPGGKFLADVFAYDHFEFVYPENPGLYFRHTPESLQAVAQKVGMNARCLGTVEKFGYPKRLCLRTNPLFEFTA